MNHLLRFGLELAHEKAHTQAWRWRGHKTSAVTMHETLACEQAARAWDAVMVAAGAAPKGDYGTVVDNVTLGRSARDEIEALKPREHFQPYLDSVLQACELLNEIQSYAADVDVDDLDEPGSEGP